MSRYCCECHGHSEWSLLDGVGSRELHAQRAAELGHTALVMTEHAVLSGTVHHMDACHRVGILPIVGLEAYYRRRRITNVEVESMRKRKLDVEEFEPYFHMVLIAKNIRGWRTLKLLSSEAYRSGFYKKPCVDDDLLEKHHDDVLISTSCISGYVPKAILRGDDAAVKQHCDMLDRLVGDDWYFELQPHGFEDLVVVNRVPSPPSPTPTASRSSPRATRTRPTSRGWRPSTSASPSAPSARWSTRTGKAGEADEKYDMKIADTAILADVRARSRTSSASTPGSTSASSSRRWTTRAGSSTSARPG
jgi:DNA polymerase III alpha subunit (gram-positive type)